MSKNMSPSRRGTAALLLGAAWLLMSCNDDDGGLGPDIPEPDSVSSRNGVLQVTLTQAPTRVTVAGRSFVSNVFNGQYIPPVLRMQRGDRLELQLVNNIGKADVQIDGPLETNVHYHGMVVTPIAPGDDVFLHVAPGATYDYRWQVPSDHSQGVHWYHPHAHGLVEPQILSGMSGMLVIDGLIAQHYTAYSGLVERHLLLKDIQLPGADPDAANTKTINGLLGGTLAPAPRRDAGVEPGQPGRRRLLRPGGGRRAAVGDQPRRQCARAAAAADVGVPAAGLALHRGGGGAAADRQLRGAHAGGGHRPARRPQPRGAAGHAGRVRAGAEHGHAAGTAAAARRRAGPDRPDAGRAGRDAADGRAHHGVFRDGRRQHLLHQRPAVVGNARRRHRDLGRRRGMDDPERQRRAPCVPHPPARLPGDIDQRRATAGRHVCATWSTCPMPSTACPAR